GGRVGVGRGGRRGAGGIGWSSASISGAGRRPIPLWSDPDWRKRRALHHWRINRRRIVVAIGNGRKRLPSRVPLRRIGLSRWIVLRQRLAACAAKADE